MVRLKLSDITDPTADALRQAGAFASDLVTPTLRLGVTGLSRAGKTVFITSLVRNLVDDGRLPFFRAHAEGRIGMKSGAGFFPWTPDGAAATRAAYEQRLAAAARLLE